MRASSPLTLEAGISTVSCAACIALRTRVRKSAMGSVIDIVNTPRTASRASGWGLDVLSAATRISRRPLPRGLGHPGDLAVVGELAQADAAQPELPVHRARAPAARAASIGPRLELGRQCLLEAQ